MSDLIDRQVAIDAVRNFVGCENGYSDTYDKAFIISALEELPPAQPEQENESVGCSGCRYDWFGDPRCNRCARSFRDCYEADMRGEQE